MSERPPVSEEDERAIRARVASAAKSRIHTYRPELLAQLLDDARDLRDLLDWERRQCGRPRLEPEGGQQGARGEMRTPEADDEFLELLQRWADEQIEEQGGDQ